MQRPATPAGPTQQQARLDAMTLDAPLDEPLLPACDVIVEDGVRRRADTFAPCAFNLGKVIMGAGMMAVPKAFFLMGFPLGTAILLGVLAITVFSLVGLITASEQTGESAATQRLGGGAGLGGPRGHPLPRLQGSRGPWGCPCHVGAHDVHA
jgi:hypothetical protein